MKKVAILIFALFLTACAPESDGLDAQERITDLEYEIEQLQKKIADLESERDEWKSDCKQVLGNETQDSKYLIDYAVVIAARSFQVGEIIPMDGFVVAPIPIDFVVETWIAGPDIDALISQVTGCEVRYAIPRGMIMTSNLVDCP